MSDFIVRFAAIAISVAVLAAPAHAQSDTLVLDKPVHLAGALNRATGWRAVEFPGFSDTRQTVRWETGFPEGTNAPCLAINAAGTLKLFACSSRLKAACANSYDPSGRQPPVATELFRTTEAAVTWPGARAACAEVGADYVFTDSIEQPDRARIWSVPERADGAASPYYWLNLLRTSDGRFAPDHSAFLQDKATGRDCAISGYRFALLSQERCNTRVSTLVCLDTLTRLFVVRKQGAPYAGPVEARNECERLGPYYRLPTPDDLYNPQRPHRYSLTSADLAEPAAVSSGLAPAIAVQDSFDNTRRHSILETGEFYVNFFATAAGFWGSRDLSNLPYVHSVAYERRFFPRNSVFSRPGDCMFDNDFEYCHLEIKYLCRDAVTGTLEMTAREGPWWEGPAACLELGPQYYFTRPRLAEEEVFSHSDNTDDVWINARLDPRSGESGRKRSLPAQAAVSDRAYISFLVLGYFMAQPPVAWRYDLLNLGTRVGPSHEDAERLALQAIKGSSTSTSTGSFQSKGRSKSGLKRPLSGDFAGLTRSASTPVTSLDSATTAATATKRRRSSKPLRIHWLDVGQGQLQVIEPFTADGPGFIIDAGAVSRDAPATDDEGDGSIEDPSGYLDSQYQNGSNMDLDAIVERVRHWIGDNEPIVVLSHADKDHINLLEHILGKPTDHDFRMPARIYFGGDKSAYRRDVKAIITAVENAEAGTVRVFHGTTLERNPIGRTLELIDGDYVARLTMVTANNQVHRGGCSAKNAGSLVATITYGDTAVYFMGDAELRAEEATITHHNGARARAGIEHTILTASHHGAVSCGSNHAGFAEALEPEVVIYPAGASEHPRCAAVQHYLSFVSAYEDHRFGCLAQSPPRHAGLGRNDPWWDGDPVFYLDPTNAARNRHAGPDPEQAGSLDPRQVYEDASGLLQPVGANAIKASDHFVLTTQETGHVRVTITMSKADEASAPVSDGYDLQVAKSGPWVSTTTTTMPPTPAPTAHDELRKRMADMIPVTPPDILSLTALPDGTMLGTDQEGRAWHLASSIDSEHWTGPLEPDADGIVAVPLADGRIYQVTWDETAVDGGLSLFTELGTFYSNDDYLDDDAATPWYGSPELCAERCLMTEKCGRFTYGWPDSGARGNFCTLFEEDAEPLPSTSGAYRMYELR